MRFTSRPYETDDLTLVRRFLAELTKDSPPHTYWHPGDFVWTLYQNALFDATRSVRLWEKGGEIVAVAILEEPDSLIMQVRPDARISRGIEREMFLWAVERLASDRLQTSHAEAIGASEDPVRSYLESIGFVRGEDYYLNLHRRLDGGEAASPRVPEGWTVRPVGPEDEWERRVELHQEVWHPSRVTLDAYRRLRGVSGYSPALDLVAVNEAGEFGAYCICWYDEISRIGLFEPVGTLEKYRRRGLGRAIMEVGLSKLAGLGAESAFVNSSGNNDASRLLYESVGFRTARVEYFYGAKTEELRANLA